MCVPSYLFVFAMSVVYVTVLLICVVVGIAIIKLLKAYCETITLSYITLAFKVCAHVINKATSPVHREHLCPVSSL
jgi:hypothetical protein